MLGTGLRARALGVSGAPAPGRRTTSFRLGDTILIDAGGAADALPLEEWTRIEHVVLSHSHMDHVMAIPFLVAEATPTLYGLPETLDAVRESLFDGRIWPDLSHRATWQPIAAGATLDLDGYRIEAGPADHSVPCLSYHVRAGAESAVIVGDTRLAPEVLDWAAARAPDLCVVECSYPDALREQAVAFGHQTSGDIAAWREALGTECTLCVTHTKPRHDDAIRAECGALGDARLRFLRDGDVLET